MIVLREFKFLQVLIGLNPLGGLRNIVVRFIGWTAMCSLLFFLNTHEYLVSPALPAVLGFGAHLMSYTHLVICRERFFSLLDELEAIVNERAKIDGRQMIYDRAENQSSFATKLLIRPSLLGAILTSFPFVVVAYDWWLGKYSLDSWTFFLPVWTPFELNTTFRCASIVFYETFTMTCTVFVFGSIPSLLVGFFIYSKAFILDLKSLFTQLDCLSKHKSTPSLPSAKWALDIDRLNTLRQSNLQSFEQQILNSLECQNMEFEMLKLCKEIIELHQNFNRLLHSLASVLNPYILQTIMLWSTSICTSLLIFGKYRGNNFIYDLQLLILANVLCLNVLSMLFYIGESFHSIVMEMSHAIYQLEWYQYPRSIQRLLILMILRAQEPFYLSAYGIIDVNLRNFLVLLKWIYSVFIVLFHQMD